MPNVLPKTEGLRERNRRQTLQRIADVGVELFLAKGYEATTLDEIATYWNGSHRPAETLDAAEWTQGVAEEALAATEAKP